MSIKTNFKNCIITKDGGFEFDGRKFHTFADFARYVEANGGKIWFKSGDIIKVKWDKE